MYVINDDETYNKLMDAGYIRTKIFNTGRTIVIDGAGLTSSQESDSRWPISSADLGLSRRKIYRSSG